MKHSFVRRDFIRSSTLAVTALASPIAASGFFRERSAPDTASSIRLGVASYTFRNFERAKLIGFLKQLNVSTVNLKDVKDHLPFDAQPETAALSDYAAAAVKLHAAGTIYFEKDEDPDIRSKFEYCKRAGIPVIVAGDPTP